MGELKQWNELYGEGGSRKKEQLSYFLQIVRYMHQGTTILFGRANISMIYITQFFNFLFFFYQKPPFSCDQQQRHTRMNPQVPGAQHCHESAQNTLQQLFHYILWRNKGLLINCFLNHQVYSQLASPSDFRFYWYFGIYPRVCLLSPGSDLDEFASIVVVI